jgi:class 3 adenylate cyclase
MRVSEYQNQVLAQAWQQAKDSNQERLVIETESERWIASFHPLSEAFDMRTWTIGLLVPEDDLIGSIKRSNRFQLGVSLSILFVAIVVGFGMKGIKNVLDTQSRFIRRTFGRYLSDDIVTAILESPEGLELGGQKRTITIVMTDLRGFTAMSERLRAEEVVAMLNEYFGDMTEIVVKWGGTIDEFIGDAILVMFGAPLQGNDDAQRAVACALEMQLAMDKVNARNKEKDYPELAMGIGINTGGVVVGNVGSLKRTKYGIVGQQVNLAARIESYTGGGQTLISTSTKDACGDLLDLGGHMEVHPKGVAEPITIYEVRGIGGSYNVHLPEHPVERNDTERGR